MKLNNKGWGTMQMILLSGGLLIALIVSIFFISQLYSSFNSDVVGNRQYVDLETKLETAAKEYIDSKNFKVNGELTINLSTLKNNNFIDEFKDSNGNDCNGYVKITNSNNISYYTGYISCENYQTINY